ncbi:MAG: Mth938-like domain-containing protein [Propionivibrio sp.]|uniref:Mth938-like domain-containing protein n=1 Tax=Candidatus Propionivibrio dominans TaxID=2954373 RepID=A0A9D7IDR8_9RHOO|nr:Mth938-like domain-containing protein [Candidatus Propionivibrio dominans]
MKLQLVQMEGQNAFTAYGEGYVSVNAIRHTSNLVVLPDRLIPDWTQASFATLNVTDFELLASLDAEIVLLGTGKQLRFPRPELLRPLIQAQKGLEVMDIQAACRTYNVLVSEGRKVAAGLIFD